MLGHALVRHCSARLDVHATVRDLGRARAFSLPAELHEFDARTPGALGPLLDEIAPGTVVNCIGLVKQLELEPVPAIALNALLPHQIAATCAERGVRLVHISSDCVFSGDLAPPGRYTEQDVPDARDLYGRTKALGEPGEAPALTIRTSFIGRELAGASGLFEWFASQSGSTVDGYSNAIFSGMTSLELARVIERIVLEQPDLDGLYHVAADPISKLDLLRRLRDATAVDCEIRPVDEPRINRALDGTAFRAATGIELPSWDAMIESFAREVSPAANA
jgi:dTDP-4-dehydrorhamnose reductase